MMRQIVVDCNVVMHVIRGWDLEHCANVPVNCESPLLPELTLGRWRLELRSDWAGRPKESTFGNGDDEEEREVKKLDSRNVDLVEPACADDEFKGDEEEDGEDVEGGLVGEDGIRFDAFECEHGSSERNLGHCIGGDVAKGVGEHRYQNGKEECISQEGEGDHDAWAEEPVELGLFTELDMSLAEI